MRNSCFCIAEHKLLLAMPDNVEWRLLLPSFVPFECPFLPDEKAVCSLEIVDSMIHTDLSAATFLVEVDRVLGERYRLYEQEGSYIMDLQMQPGGEYSRMACNISFTKGYACIGGSGHESGEVLNIFLMMLFAQAATLHRTVLMHASVVVKGGRGYAFLGESGTGKSTHSALWLRVFEDAELLNDDNPAVRLMDDRHVYIYGTPWSGKTPCYKNRKVKLAAWVRLEQAPVNSFTHKSGIGAFVTLLPSCSAMRWNDRLYAALCDLLEGCIRYVPVGHLQCRPDEEAVSVCYNELMKRSR